MIPIATELGVAYLSLAASTGQFGKDVKTAFGGIEGVAERSGKRSGGLIGGALSKGLGIGVKAVAGLGAAVVGLAATGGISRAIAIEGAEKKLEGLGHSAKSIETIMGNALSSVRGTAYGLGDAAGVAAMMTASGVKEGKALEASLKSIADVAAISGRSLTDVGMIYGSIAARGKLQGDDMRQLMAAGIPVTQLLGKELGKTAAEVSDMVSKGKIDFATFQKAMQAGMGGAALKSGETFKGALANVYAALGRLGALVATPALGALKTLFNAAIPAIDGVTAKLKPLMDALGPKLETATKAGVDAVSSTAGEIGTYLGYFRSLYDSVGGGMAGIGEVVDGVLLEIQASLASAGVDISGFTAIFAGIDFGALVQAGSQILSTLSPLGLIFKSLQPLLPQLAQAFADLANQGLAILVPLITQLGPLFAQVGATLVAAGTRIASALLPVLMQLASAILPVIGQVIGALVPVVGQLVAAFLPVVGVVADLVTALLPPLAAAIMALLPAVMPLVDAVLGLVQSLLPVVGIVVQLVQTLLPPLVAVFQALLPPIVNLVTTIAGALAPVLSAVTGIITALMPVLSMLVGWLGAIVAAIAPVVAVILGGLINVIAALIGWIGGVVTAIANWVADAIPAIGGFVTTVGSKIGEAIDWFVKLPGRIMDAIGNLGNMLIDSGKSLVDGFLRGIKSAWDNLVGWVKNGMETLRGLWPFSPAQWGPFSGRGYVTYSGKALGEDFAASLAAQRGLVQSAALGLMDAASLSRASASIPALATPTGSDSDLAAAFASALDERGISILALSDRLSALEMSALRRA